MPCDWRGGHPYHDESLIESNDEALPNGRVVSRTCGQPNDAARDKSDPPHLEQRCLRGHEPCKAGRWPAQGPSPLPHGVLLCIGRGDIFKPRHDPCSVGEPVLSRQIPPAVAVQGLTSAIRGVL